MNNRLPQLSHKHSQQPLTSELILRPIAVDHHAEGRGPTVIPTVTDVGVAAPKRGVGDGFEEIPVAQHHAAAPALSMTVLIGAAGCRWTPLSLKRIPSASSAETTRCSARALALG